MPLNDNIGTYFQFNVLPLLRILQSLLSPNTGGGCVWCISFKRQTSKDDEKKSSFMRVSIGRNIPRYPYFVTLEYVKIINTAHLITLNTLHSDFYYTLMNY